MPNEPTSPTTGRPLVQLFRGSSIWFDKVSKEGFDSRDKFRAIGVIDTGIPVADQAGRFSAGLKDTRSWTAANYKIELTYLKDLPRPQARAKLHSAVDRKFLAARLSLKFEKKMWEWIYRAWHEKTARALAECHQALAKRDTEKANKKPLERRRF